MSTLDWERFNLYFPQWEVVDEKTKEEGLIFGNFSENAVFGKIQINFLFKENYGVELKFNSVIPDWIPKTNEITEIYKTLTKKIYENVIGELNNSFETFENWRKFFVNQYIESKGAIGLQDNLSFVNEGDKISLGDYYSIGREGMEGYPISPTDKLVKIRNLPKKSLNEKWLEYFELSKYVTDPGRRDTSNSIIGSSISNCVKKADKIYKIAGELKNLKI